MSEMDRYCQRSSCWDNSFKPCLYITQLLVTRVVIKAFVNMELDTIWGIVCCLCKAEVPRQGLVCLPCKMRLNEPIMGPMPDEGRQISESGIGQLVSTYEHMDNVIDKIYLFEFLR